MSDTCAFCGHNGDHFKPEHWVSQWISRALIPQGKGIEHHVIGLTPWRAPIVDLTVDHVCEDCNHHWMSDIETRARNNVLALVRGETLTLNQSQQQRVATWCFLKAITSELGRPLDQEATYPPFFYEAFKRALRPLNGCLVSIGFMEASNSPDRLLWFRSNGNKTPGPDGGDLTSYRTTFTISHLVVDVLGVIDPRVVVKIEEIDERFNPIWPSATKSLNWPPVARFTGIVNDDLV